MSTLAEYEPPEEEILLGLLPNTETQILRQFTIHLLGPTRPWDNYSMHDTIRVQKRGQKILRELAAKGSVVCVERRSQRTGRVYSKTWQRKPR